MRWTVVFAALLALACGGGQQPVDGAVVEPSEPPASAAAPGACPAGTHVYGGWQGEYPAPAVDVKRPWAAKGRASPCGEPTVACTVPAGLYHPWSTTTQAEFNTVVWIERHRAKRPYDAEADPPLVVPVGGEVEILGYHGEGYCQLRYQGRDFDAECPGMDEDAFEKISGAPQGATDRQVMRVRCAEGAEAWIDVSEAIFGDDVKEGEITGYGEVGPAE